ncbi:MAG: HNH endonuclease [Patescibacteria group bacterium]
MAQAFCYFCGQNNPLTIHEIIAQSYGGQRILENIIDVCRNCHNQLENNMNKAKGLIGAGRAIPSSQIFSIGSISACLETGSILLNDDGKANLNFGSLIYGMRAHQKSTGENYIEVIFSGNEIIVTGSPAKDWCFYSIALASGTESLVKDSIIL